MEIIVGYLSGALYYKCMLCALIRIASPRGDSNECTQHTFARIKKKICLNYPEEIPADSRTCSNHPW